MVFKKKAVAKKAPAKKRVVKKKPTHYVEYVEEGPGWTYKIKRLSNNRCIVQMPIMNVAGQYLKTSHTKDEVEALFKELKTAVF